jgi:hypothetical protein
VLEPSQRACCRVLNTRGTSFPCNNNIVDIVEERNSQLIPELWSCRRCFPLHNHASCKDMHSSCLLQQPAPVCRLVLVQFVLRFDWRLALFALARCPSARLPGLGLPIQSRSLDRRAFVKGKRTNDPCQYPAIKTTGLLRWTRAERG